MRQAGAMRAGGLAGAAVCAAALLWAFGPGLTDLPARPGQTLQWMHDDPERALLTATALAAWALLAWLTLGLVMCALTAVPGTAGSVAERLSRHVVPATVRRAAGLAVGASLATAPLLSAGTAMAAAPVPSSQSAAAATPRWQSAAAPVPPPVVATPQPADPAGPAPGPGAGWPDLGRHPSSPPPADSTGTIRPPASTPAPPDSPAPPQARPDAPASIAPPETAAPPAPPDPAPASSPAPLTPPAPARPDARSEAAAGPASPPGLAPGAAGVEPATYQVRRGDCLWTIAARSLGPGAGPADIEAAWHRWYQANRDVVGADPNLLLPGQRLTPPTS